MKVQEFAPEQSPEKTDPPEVNVTTVALGTEKLHVEMLLPAPPAEQLTPGRLLCTVTSQGRVPVAVQVS